MAGCILHLRQLHVDSLSQQVEPRGQVEQAQQQAEQQGQQAQQRPPFRLAMVGYSMGGEVARLALRWLKALDPGFGEQQQQEPGWSAAAVG